MSFETIPSPEFQDHYRKALEVTAETSGAAVKGILEDIETGLDRFSQIRDAIFDGSDDTHKLEDVSPDELSAVFGRVASSLLDSRHAQVFGNEVRSNRGGLAIRRRKYGLVTFASVTGQRQGINYHPLTHEVRFYPKEVSDLVKADKIMLCRYKYDSNGKKIKTIIKPLDHIDLNDPFARRFFADIGNAYKAAKAGPRYV